MCVSGSEPDIRMIYLLTLEKVIEHCVCPSDSVCTQTSHHSYWPIRAAVFAGIPAN